MPGDDAGVSAVLVESSKFYYVYGCVGAAEAYGVQQVVDMELHEGERVLGARLVPCAPCATNGAGGGGGGGARQVLLVLVTAGRVLVHALSGAA